MSGIGVTRRLDYPMASRPDVPGGESVGCHPARHSPVTFFTRSSLGFTMVPEGEELLATAGSGMLIWNGA